MRTLKELATEAIQIQDAYNQLGLSKGYAAALADLREALAEVGQECGTAAIRNHPINQLWVSKLHELARMGLSDEDCYSRAYEECKRLLAEGECWHPVDQDHRSMCPGCTSDSSVWGNPIY